jgi:hypothetical protein
MNFLHASLRAVRSIFIGAILSISSFLLDLAAESPAQRFWAFKPLGHSPIPAVESTGFPVRNPVDAFVLDSLQRRGLQPSPPASRQELGRRLFFDLTGLPPTPEEMAAFVNDPSPDAYERLVDRLLESPHFGERWAQHWLDVVRFAETEGFEYDGHLPEAWRFRDYVIEATQNDKPFDHFLTEQISGDERHPGPSDGARAAIFHRLGPVRRNAGNPEIALSRNEILTERTDVIGAAFLGLTVGCARCHDHKIDPISQKDYYRLQAYIAASQEIDIPLVSKAEQSAWETTNQSVQDQLRILRKAVDGAEGTNRIQLKAQIAALEHSLPPRPPTLPSVRNDPTLRTAIHVLKRGEWERKGEPVGPRPLSILVEEDRPESPPDLEYPRTELARWLTDPSHPLTSRVIVNRLFQNHFGTGLVKTPNDFGLHGDRPSHPELLDWLARELLNQGWRLKPIHRLLVCSSTYRQSTHSPQFRRSMELDPENRLLWHFKPRRLSAEELRDAMLAVSGILNRRIAGPSVLVPVDSELVQLLYKPDQWKVTADSSEHHRRSIYLIAKRNLRLPFLESFDQPSLISSCGRRESSTHAPQALELLNGSLSNELAQRFAERLRRESGGDPLRFIDRAYQLALNRPPTSEELQRSLTFLQDQPPREFALALFNLNAFLYVP